MTMQTTEEFRRCVRSFLKENVIENYDSICQSKAVLKTVWNEAGACGFFRCSGDTRFAGYNDLDYSLIVLEELGKAYVMDFPFWLQGEVIAYFLSRYGTEEQKNRYLKDVLLGKKIAAFALTEEHGGSDISSIRTEATEVGNEYAVTGKKKYITNGSIADFYLVVAYLCKSDKKNMVILIIDRQLDGVKVDSLGNEESVKALDLAQISFDNVMITNKDLLGNMSNATIAVLKGLTIERFALSLISQTMCLCLLE